MSELGPILQILSNSAIVFIAATGFLFMVFAHLMRFAKASFYGLPLSLILFDKDDYLLDFLLIILLLGFGAAFPFLLFIIDSNFFDGITLFGWIILFILTSTVTLYGALSGKKTTNDILSPKARKISKALTIVFSLLSIVSYSMFAFSADDINIILQIVTIYTSLAYPLYLLFFSVHFIFNKTITGGRFLNNEISARTVEIMVKGKLSLYLVAMRHSKKEWILLPCTIRHETTSWKYGEVITIGESKHRKCYPKTSKVIVFDSKNYSLSNLSGIEINEVICNKIRIKTQMDIDI